MITNNRVRNMGNFKSMEWTKLERITTNPEIMEGQPCIRGLRIPVSVIIKLVAVGKTKKEILEHYPELEEEDIKQYFSLHTI